jgi:hypothetical protein
MMKTTIPQLFFRYPELRAGCVMLSYYSTETLAQQGDGYVLRPLVLTL